MKTIRDFKGTKGDFLIKETNRHILVVDVSDKEICNLNFYNPRTIEEAEANAKLFAASKKMLEALYEINCLCADASKIENGKVDYDKIAKISYNIINDAI